MRADRTRPGDQTPAAKRMQAYRARLRRDGLRLVQFWAPDTASPAYIARCREQSLAVAAHDPGGEAVMRDIKALRDWSGLSNDPA